MGKQARERMLSGVELLLILAWLGGAILVAQWFIEVTGHQLSRSGRFGLAALIFFVPIGVAVALDEFVIRRIRYGPSKPGRRKRGLEPGQLPTPELRSKHQDRDTPES